MRLCPGVLLHRHSADSRFIQFCVFVVLNKVLCTVCSNCSIVKTMYCVNVIGVDVNVIKLYICREHSAMD